MKDRQLNQILDETKNERKNIIPKNQYKGLIDYFQKHKPELITKKNLKKGKGFIAELMFFKKCYKQFNQKNISHPETDPKTTQSNDINIKYYNTNYKVEVTSYYDAITQGLKRKEKSRGKTCGVHERRDIKKLKSKIYDKCKKQITKNINKENIIIYIKDRTNFCDEQDFFGGIFGQTKLSIDIQNNKQTRYLDSDRTNRKIIELLQKENNFLGMILSTKNTNICLWNPWRNISSSEKSFIQKLNINKTIKTSYQTNKISYQIKKD